MEPERHEIVIDGPERELIRALQADPRATWSKLAAALRVDAVTVGRRWSRLERAGIAWVSAQPLRERGSMGAFVEVSCEPGRAGQVATDLAADPQCMTVDLTNGARDIILSVAARTRQDMAEYVLRRFVGVPDVTRVVTRFMLKVYADASDWQTRTSTPRRRVSSAGGTSVSTDFTPTAAEWDIAVALGKDGRMSAADLARNTGLSDTTVRRRLSRLLTSGQLRLRCDVARELSGEPISVWLFLRVPADRLDQIGGAIGSLPPVRLCVATEGTANLVANAWVTSLEAVTNMETSIARAAKGIEVSDRCIVLRTTKRVGRVIGPDGRAVGIAVTDFRHVPPWPIARA